MKEMKRILALVLCFVMLVGMMPAVALNADAAGNTHYLMFATDRHANTSVIGNIINNMESVIGENTLEYLGLGGDMVGSGNTHPEYDSSEVLAEVTGATSSLNASNVDIVAGIHDMNVTDDAGIVLPYQGGGARIYEGDDYYVYGVEEYCISEDSNESNWSAQAEAFQNWALGDTIDTSKVIFVVSHYPLHAKRDDNDGAYYWHKALNTVATGAASGDSTVERNIVFFHGHNHTKDTNEYVYDVGDTMSIQNGSSTVSDTIYYTYATAGYLNQNSKATLVTLTDDTIILTKYSTSGSGTAMTSVERVITETTPTVNTVTAEDTTNIVTAVGLGLTGVTLTQSENADTSAFSECVAYDVALEGYTEGDTVTLTFDIGYMDSTDLVVYANGEQITPVSVEDNTEDDFHSVLVTVETTSATGTYIIGKLGAAEDAVLTGISVTSMPKVTSYTLVVDENADGNIYLDITGLVITATYEDGTSFPVEWNRFEDETDGYALEFDISVAGTRTVKVTYGGLETSFDVTVYEHNAVDADVAEAVAGVLRDGYIAKEFAPTDYTEGTEIRVVMPAPEGANVVYHVADDGTLTEVENVTFQDSYAIFDTDHFSAYVVGETTVTVDDPETATGSGDVTTTTPKTVYVLTNSISSGNDYLIANSNSASTTTRYLLARNGSSIAATGVTIQSGDVDGDGETDTYIELDDATDELWTVDGSYTFQNGGYYLRYSSGLSLSTSSSTTWTYSGNKLYYDANTDRYLRYNNSWTTTNSSYFATSIYFYVPTEIDVKTTTNVSGTYSIAGEDVTKVVNPDATEEQTAELIVTLAFTPEGSDIAEPVDLPEDFYENLVCTVVSDENDIIDDQIEQGVVILTGNYGEALVKISYESDFGTVTNYITVTATEPVYDMNVIEPETAQLKIGTTLELEAVVTITGEESETETDKITWTSSNSEIATVNENGVVTAVAEGDVTITATYTDPKDEVHTDEVSLNIVDAVWDLNLHYAETVLKEDGTVSEVTVGDEITAPIVKKEVTSGETYDNLWAVITKDGEDIGTLEDYSDLTWVSSNSNIASVDPASGIVTFNGGEGTVIITAIYEYAEGKSVTDTVVFSVSADRYYIPEDGTDDFPEYPNEGAIRFDKTATAVGNFSQTGIAKVELSMTGVPFTTGNELDVVVMLDMTGSMTDTDDRIPATEAAAKAFVKSIVQNEDGSYNTNRVAVYTFNSGGQGGTDTTYELFALGTVSNDEELAELNTLIDGASDTQKSGGTPYDVALETCDSVLTTARGTEIGKDRQQFCVFMSDGVPTDYQYSATGNYSSASDIAGMLTSASDYATRDTDYYYEYYSTKMKSEGVTVYTVGLGLENKNSAWTGTDTQCLNLASVLLNDISGPAYETELDTGSDLSKKDSYFFSVDDADAATEMEEVFKNIARKILDAAKDVKVTDKISDDYTMVFDFPNSTVGEILDGQEFYIEVIDYALNPVKNAAGEITDYTRGTATSLLKLYLGTNADGSYYAATANGSTNGSNAFATPTFAKVTLGASGSKYHWSTDSAKGDCGVSVTGTYTDDNGDTQTATFYFVSGGTGEYNMTSGAYAHGTPTTVEIENTDETTGETTTTESTTCEDLIIATPYFVYNASTRILIWTAEKLSSSELALSYFLYLENSGGFTGADGEETEIPAGTYETNDYAYLNYINFNGNPCEQEFPKPQMTWNGAQVSYVFYLVNEDGQPVNRAGKVIPFSEAVYVTDVYTYSIIWNKLEQTAGLEAERLAINLVPDVYELYDKDAAYKIHVYENENYVNLNNHFVIESGLNNYTTYVFNTKADATKYTNPGTYVAYNSDTATSNKPYMCKDYEGVTVTLNEDGTIASASYSGSYIQVTPNQEGSAPADYTDSDNHVYYIDGNGEVYTIVYKYDGTEVHSSFDFSNTTVAFAVVWKPELVEDTVVVDYGLDVIIDVTANDALASGVVGVRTTAPGGIAMNWGTYPNAAQQITTDIMLNDAKIATATVESLSAVRFSLDETNGMQFSEPVEFFYESAVNYYEGTDLERTHMYSSVTVIPATTIYYEDEFVDLKTHVKQDNDEYEATDGWDVDSITASATQAQDRPGESKISADLDADNNYGYDAAYSAMSTYSMNRAAMVNVTTGKYATATFTFYGTGFDVISMTSNTTGTLTVKIVDANGAAVKNMVVDTYYGYTRDTEGNWVATPAVDNALYQVPVIKAEGLTYGKYTVTITASYVSLFDHTSDKGSYDLYLDAIRIYDPANDGANNKVVEDAYKADGEGWPSYQELRNNIISAEGVTTTTDAEGNVTVTFPTEDTFQKGAIFIDGNAKNYSIADYVSYGPNNELYLANEQAIAFKVTDSNIADIQLGIKVASGGSVTYKINGDSYTVNTATDMYYSILDYAKNSQVVTIENVSGGILSLTNIKVTHTEAPAEESGISLLSMDAESAGVALMMLRRAPVIEEEIPETTEPETTEPETTEPETTELETTEPETTEPEVTEPETTEPETTEPETTEPETTEPEVTEPEETPSVGQVVKEIVKGIVNVLGKLFSRWF